MMEQEGEDAVKIYILLKIQKKSKSKIQGSNKFKSLLFPEPALLDSPTVNHYLYNANWENLISLILNDWSLK
jgi:hypothetical protein